MKIYTEQELTKAYYSIGELAKMFDVNASLIRFWQKEFSSYINPKVNARGKRYFRPKDVVNFSKVYHLIKVKGFTLEGAKANLKSGEFEEEVIVKTSNNQNIQQELIHRLEQLKIRLLQLSNQ